ncbi:hypothetical protein R1sor_018688 [Riccia sorocarpa]|uniref:Uncharacterized protein n=1 Tax=Riccia sorocarpa TaxID=122646 RepID=A0ABD3IBH5_9MARC
MVATSGILFVGVALLLLLASASAQLSESFYATSCPGGVQAVANVVTAAGCDASVLLAIVPGGPKAEEDAGRNLSLQGFGIID